MVAVNQASASFRKRAQERASRATHLTPGDVESLETSPGQCPHNYDGLLRLLAAYLRFLLILCGPMCSHYMEVRSVRRTLCRKVAIYEPMPPEDVAQIVWGIFMDARDFYSSVTVNPLPTSNLLFLRSWLETGTVKTTGNCPVGRLLGKTREIPPTAGTDRPSEWDIFTPAGAGGKKSKKVNPTFNATLKAATAQLLATHPDVRFNEIMNAPTSPMTYADVRVGTPGSCLDMHYFGRCLQEGCNYKHGRVGTVPGERVEKVLPALKTAVSAYMATSS